jgi:hypothetical protein
LNSDKQDYATFGFSIPAGNVIDGIVVKLRVRRGTGENSLNVDLSYDAGAHYTPGTPKNTGTLPIQYAVVTLGSATDTWGRTWSVSEINDADGNFRLRLTHVRVSGTSYVDAIQVRVYHHAGGGTPGGGGEL